MTSRRVKPSIGKNYCGRKFHCVTSWSRVDNLWEGVLMKAIADIAGCTPHARLASIFPEELYSVTLTLEEILDDDVLLDTVMKAGLSTPNMMACCASSCLKNMSANLPNGWDASSSCARRK